MTIDEHDINGGSTDPSSSFQGLMESLNLDPQEFKEYPDFSTTATAGAGGGGGNDNNSTGQKKITFQELDIIKRDIERQLNILFELLQKKYNCDMDTPLVSRDGYPRNDIDVVSIRLIRVRIIRLKNDYKKVIHLLDELMTEEFAKRHQDQPPQLQDDEREREGEGSSSSSGGGGRGPQLKYNIPFAKVAQVVNNGPAYQAGLKENDEIILFDDDIHASNNNKLQSLISRVKIDKPINVEIKRKGNEQDEKISLILIPSDNWDGQGLLGCRLLPI